MKDKIISSIRILIAAFLSFIFVQVSKYVVITISPEMQYILDGIVTELSTLIGTSIIYYLTRLLEKINPNLLFFRIPESVSKLQ